VNDKRRQIRREIRTLQREATWLQKALFALGKVEEARDKLDEMRGEEHEPFMIEVEGGGAIALEQVEEALAERVKALLETVREERRNLR